MTPDVHPQRIAKLTPLADVLDSLSLSVEPVSVIEVSLADAVGRTLAADVTADRLHPARPLAMRDGYPVSSEATLDASAYAPAPLAQGLVPLATGEALPAGADAVADADLIVATPGSMAITSVVGPGENVLTSGIDATPGVLKLAGARLRRVDIAALAALDVSSARVRIPRLRITTTSDAAPLIAVAAYISRAVEAEGGEAVIDNNAWRLDVGGYDATISIGGTGVGPHDRAVTTLQTLGRVAYHGIAIQPGQTIAFGFIDAQPVLLLPGRLDAALAGWLTLGRRVLARLAFRLIEEQPFPLELSRKISSPLGLADVVPVRRRANTVEPIAQGYLPAQALLKSDGWILVPADSEGYPVGAKVVVRPWP